MKKPDQKVINAVKELKHRNSVPFSILNEYITTEYNSILQKTLYLNDVSDFRLFQGMGRALDILQVLFNKED